MSNVQHIDFMIEIAFNKKLPVFYDTVYQNLDRTILFNSETTDKPILFDKINLVIDIPSYLDVKKKAVNPSIEFKSIKQYNGYCIDLSGYHDLETYLKDQFSSSSRQLLRSGKNKLEKCFDISYKMYYGEIEKEHYHELFKQFYDMLKLRAHEKGIYNRNLKVWDEYTNSVYDMILKKEASLFVIYDGEKVINLSLNMHMKNTIFLFISTYNIDYSKFRLGHTNWMVLLDWFIKNNIKMVDFSKGNIAYKKRWANKEYHFEYHLFYDKSKIKIRLKALWIIKKLQLKQALRNRNINTYYYKALRILKGNNRLIKIPNSQLINQKQLPEKSKLSQVLFRKNDTYLFLKRIIYNYLYLSTLNVKDVKVYEDLDNSDTFYVQSPKEVLKLTIKT